MPQFLFGLALLIASYFITAMMTPKPVKPKPALLSDFDIPQIEEGTPQCVVFGDVWIPDWMVLWYGDYRTSPIMSDVGGK